MTFNNRHFLLSGPGLLGGHVNSTLVFFLKNSQNTGHLDIHNISAHLTPTNSDEIVSRASVEQSLDGAYKCEYQTPKKKGCYMLHIRVDGNPYSSPYPVFFDDGSINDSNSTLKVLKHKNSFNNTSNEVDCHNKLTEQSLNTNCTHLSWAPESLRSHLIDKIQAESTWIEALELPALITVNQLHDLFCLYGQLTLGNFKKDFYRRHVFLKFDHRSSAETSLLFSGTLFGDKPLLVKKWVEPCLVQKAKKIIDGNSISTVQTERMLSLSEKKPKKLYQQCLEQCKKNWRHQRTLMERYVALTTASHLKPNSPLIQSNNSQLPQNKKNDIQQVKTLLIQQIGKASTNLSNYKHTNSEEWDLL